MLRAGWILSFCNLGAETSRELTLPGGQGILKLLLVTGMDKIKDIVSDQLQLGGREAEGCLGGKAFLQGPLTHLLITLPQFMNLDYFPSLLIHSFLSSAYYLPGLLLDGVGTEVTTKTKPLTLRTYWVVGCKLSRFSHV